MRRERLATSKRCKGHRDNTGKSATDEDTLPPSCDVVVHLLVLVAPPHVLAVDQARDGLRESANVSSRSGWAAGTGRISAHLLDLGGLDLEPLSDLRDDFHDATVASAVSTMSCKAL